MSSPDEARTLADLEVTGQARIMCGERAGMVLRVCRTGIWGGSPRTNYYSLLLLGSLIVRGLRLDRRWRLIVVAAEARDADGEVVGVYATRSEAIERAMALLHDRRED